MKVLDYSPIPFNGGKIPLQEKIKGIFQLGFTWISEMKSQEVVVANLSRVLDNRYTLLRNVPLPEGGVTIPLILFGPQGITVICNSPLRGIFRASGDSWEIMDNRLRNFKPTRPNLLKRSELMTRAFDSFLKQHEYKIDADGVLIFTDPGIHVNTMHPNIRIILMDAIDRFGARLIQEEQVMSVEDIRTIINSLEIALQPEEKEIESSRIIPHQQLAESVDSGFQQAIQPLQKRLDFSKRQWILLGGFITIDILVLIGFLLYILLNV